MAEIFEYLTKVLGKEEEGVWKRIAVFGILGAVMFWSAIYTVVQIIKIKNGI